MKPFAKKNRSTGFNPSWVPPAGLITTWFSMSIPETLCFNPSWVPPAGLIGGGPSRSAHVISFNPSWVPPAGLIQVTIVAHDLRKECFNPSWVPPAGLIQLVIGPVDVVYPFQSLMGATGRSNPMTYHVFTARIEFQSLMGATGRSNKRGRLIELTLGKVSIPHGATGRSNSNTPMARLIVSSFNPSWVPPAGLIRKFYCLSSDD